MICWVPIFLSIIFWRKGCYRKSDTRVNKRKRRKLTALSWHFAIVALILMHTCHPQLQWLTYCRSDVSGVYSRCVFRRTGEDPSKSQFMRLNSFCQIDLNQPPCEFCFAVRHCLCSAVAYLFTPSLLFCPCLGYPGEGPRFAIATANVTSLPKNFHSAVAVELPFKEADFSLLCMQESRIHPLRIKRLCKNVEKEGWNLHAGYQPPLKKITLRGKKVCRQSHGGLAAFSKSHAGLHQRTIPSEFDLGEIVQSLFLCVDCCGINVLNCYLPSGPKFRRQRDQIMQRIFQYAATLEPGPMLILGDFQDPPERCPATLNALRTGDWIDLVEVFSAASGVSIPFTFSRGTGKTKRSTSRIDYILANPEACKLIHGVTTVTDAGFPDHRPVAVELSYGSSPVQAFQLASSGKWTFPPKPSTPELWTARNAKVQRILAPHLSGLCSAAAALDVESTWQKACGAVSDILNSLSENHVSLTKGSFPEFQLAETRIKAQKCSVRSRRIARALAGFRELIKKVGIPGTFQTFARRDQYNKLCNNLRHLTVDLLGFPVSMFLVGCVHDCHRTFVAFQEHVQQGDLQQKRAAIAKWKGRLRISSRADRKDVHKWLQGSFAGTPKLMQNEDMTITGSVPEMLDAITRKMESIYHTHEKEDPHEMLAKFEEKYEDFICQCFHRVDMPDLCDVDFWAACQDKSPSTSGGLDQWKFSDLQQLPECGWTPFRLVALLAEATGKWPQVVRAVSVSCIPKDDSPVLKPGSIRAIGVASAVYSLWSSIRFRQLGDWQNQVAPPQILGGIPHRSSEEHELSFSLALQDPQPDDHPVSIFLDRFKCFDLVLPEVALGIAKRCGLPDQIYQACLGFYDNQVRFFKIGTFYGPRVWTANSALQGCSMSVLMINIMYSVMTRMIYAQCPGISLSSYIDDCKLWAPVSRTTDLIAAFRKIAEFDERIGQVLNLEKSQVLAPSLFGARKVIRRIRKPLAATTKVKALGRSFQMNQKRDSSLQTKRVQKALLSLRKIAALPLSHSQKQFYIQTHAHSKWTFGSETQGLSLRTIQQLRVATVNCLDPSQHNLRSPFLLLAVQQDPFLDPFGRWVWHVFSTLRRLAKHHHQTAKAIFESTQKIGSPQSSVVNGIHKVFRFLLDKLDWEIQDPAILTVKTCSGSFGFSGFSDNFFKEVVGDAVRSFLIHQLKDRYETGDIPPDSRVDVALTRYLLDRSFATPEDVKRLAPFIQRLPVNFNYARNLLQLAQSGRVVTAPRLAAMGKSRTRHCDHCDVVESHHHLFALCPKYEHTRPTNIPTAPSLSWNTGIVFSPCIRFENHLWDFPIFQKHSANGVVFIDGSCFPCPRKDLQTASSAYCVGRLQYVQSLPGPDQSSQRAELFALLLVLQHFSGDVDVACDCQNVVSGFLYLKSGHFRSSLVERLDNRDIWAAIAFAALQFDGVINVFKVKAHVVDSGSIDQSPHLSAGNRRVDELARNHAYECFSSKLSEFDACVSRALDLQTHMISTLASRKFSGFPSIDDLPQQASCFKVCKCPPKTRIRGKSSPGCSCFAQPSLILANLEHRFASAASNGQITAALFDEICQHYRQFADQLDEWKTLAPWALFALPSDVSCKKYHCSMTNRIFDSLRSYVEAVNISLDHRDSESRVPWLLVFLDFCTQSSDVAWLESQGSFHKAVCHFRVMFTSVARACGHRIHPHKKVSLLHDFGFGSLTGFIGGIRLRYPLRVWFALVYAALSFVSASVDTRKPRKFEPDISEFFRTIRALPHTLAADSV